MSVDAKVHHPALVTDLPEAVRSDFARVDLMTIEATSRQQVEVHQYALTAADTVLKTVATADVPNSVALLGLWYKATEESRMISDDQKHTPSSAARSLVTPKMPRPQHINERDIKKEVLAEWHPDKVGKATAKKDTEEKFKGLSAALSTEDVITAQGTYAATVAASALESGLEDPATLEMARYKAWLGMEAGKGRFETIEAVDEWLAREIERVPLTIRSGQLQQARILFLRALGGGEDSSIRLPITLADPVDGAIDAVSKTRKSIGDESQDVRLGRYADTDAFDEAMSGLIIQLEMLLALPHEPLSDWSFLRHDIAQDAAKQLKKVAELLAPRKEVTVSDLGRVALFSLGMDEPSDETEIRQKSGLRKDRKTLIDNIARSIISDSFKYKK